MFMLFAGADVIGSWDSRVDAERVLSEILTQEPEAEPHLTLIEFDEDGMPKPDLGAQLMDEFSEDLRILADS